jgi:hypothetical protein
VQAVSQKQSRADALPLLLQQVDPPGDNANKRAQESEPHQPVCGAPVSGILVAPGQEIKKGAREPERQGEMDREGMK